MRTLTCTVLALTACLATLPAWSALAKDHRSNSAISLKGTFRFSTVKTCTDSATASTAHFYVDGTIIYDGHGSAHLTHIDPHGSVLILSAVPSVKELLVIPGRGVSEYLCGASGTAVRIR
ncbi:MAG: hypothetical protein HZC50_09935 [Nitrospirae bacterium]|nr:hypothetical protein [Nitrospirota bacterium]